MSTFFEKQYECFLSNAPFVTVTLVDVIGSSPQDPGSKMLVTQEGLFYGTVGGGKLEKKALDEALSLLSQSSPVKSTHFVHWDLKRDVGMTCGGSVKLYFEVFHLNPWEITIFGAGHVANALIPLLLNLDCCVHCIDPREEWLNKLPNAPNLTKIQSSDMPSEVQNIGESAFVLLMTMGHTTDKPILLEILQTRSFPYLGVIGSQAKAARLKKDIAEAGLPAAAKSAFYCPIGLDLGSNHPHEIAISIVAQLIQERDRIRSPHHN